MACDPFPQKYPSGHGAMVELEHTLPLGQGSHCVSSRLVQGVAG